jgi:hypothetical protein
MQKAQKYKNNNKNLKKHRKTEITAKKAKLKTTKL